MPHTAFTLITVTTLNTRCHLMTYTMENIRTFLTFISNKWKQTDKILNTKIHVRSGSVQGHERLKHFIMYFHISNLIGL